MGGRSREAIMRKREGRKRIWEWGRGKGGVEGEKEWREIETGEKRGEGVKKGRAGKKEKKGREWGGGEGGRGGWGSEVKHAGIPSNIFTDFQYCDLNYCDRA